MDFFDRLEETGITHGGTIRGCFEEIYDGISVSDQLREMLVNEDGENASAYSESEMKQASAYYCRSDVEQASVCCYKNEAEQASANTTCPLSHSTEIGNCMAGTERLAI